jgi:Pentapeptide repeats (8 copies)
LESANLSRADLTDANLAGARLIRAEMFETRVNYVNFTQANLEGAKFFGSTHCEDGCVIVDRTIMPNGKLEEGYRLL